MNLKKILPVLEWIWVTLIMSSSITFILTYINIWFWNDFVYLWLKSFSFAFFLLTPIALSSTFIFDMLINAIFWKNISDLVKKILLSIIVWCTIEFFMSFITTFNTNWFWNNFFYYWFILYIKSLPLGIIIWLIMSFIVKPWMWRHK